jgi:hypothetical protein
MRVSLSSSFVALSRELVFFTAEFGRDLDWAFQPSGGRVEQPIPHKFLSGYPSGRS